MGHIDLGTVLLAGLMVTALGLAAFHKVRSST